MNPETPTSTPVAVTGSEIVITYELSTDEELVDQTPEGKPLTIVLGRGDVHPVLEAYFLNRHAGEDFEVTLDPSVAFGEPDERLRFQIARKKLPEALRDIGVGATFDAPGPDRGKLRTFRIVEATERRLTVDGNHPLAGQALRLKARILAIKRA